MSISRRCTQHLLAALISLAALGCDDDARVTVRYDEVARLPSELLTVTVTDPFATHTLRGRDIGGSGREGRQIETPIVGKLRVAFRFATGSAVVSEGAAEVPLRADWIYGFSVQVDSVNPTRFCFGCMGSQAFALDEAYRRSARDSVWLVWGGNSIKNPVVY